MTYAIICRLRKGKAMTILAILGSWIDSGYLYLVTMATHRIDYLFHLLYVQNIHL